MSEINIRPAIDSDLSTLLSFEQGIIKAERPFDATLGADPISYYNLADLINSQDAEVIVATDNDELVGSGFVKINKAKAYLDHELYGYLGFMYVKEEYRGKGINKLVIQALMEWCKQRNIHEVRLEVYDENQAAIRAYEKAGFRKNLVEMRLRLDS